VRTTQPALEQGSLFLETLAYTSKIDRRTPNQSRTGPPYNVGNFLQV
jgi:hypothetical protein